MFFAAYPRLARAIPLIAASLFYSSITQAAEASAQTPAATPIERQADMALWRRSGAAELQSAASYDAAFAARYTLAYQQYLAWRYGPEFLAEVARRQKQQ